MTRQIRTQIAAPEPDSSVTVRRIERTDNISKMNGLHCADVVAVEEPLELRLAYYDQASSEYVERSISITMRTPGADADLAMGFLITEGIIRDSTQVIAISPCGPAASDGTHNIIKVTLQPEVEINVGSLLRNFYTTSSCGVCGKSSLDALKTQTQYDIDHSVKLSAKYLLKAANLLRQQQTAFSQTGGNHAAGLMSTQGEMIAVREDVGRHNALDKLIGHCAHSQQLPLRNSAIILSGRSSFELLQKSVMAGVGIVAAVGAPSSLAIDCAVEYDVTLVGFLSDQQFNIYHQPARIVD